MGGDGSGGRLRLQWSGPERGAGKARPYTDRMAVLRRFASVRGAAGTGKIDVPGDTVGDVLAAADEKFGQGFAGMAATCRVWLNGESATATDVVGADDEVALIPPVSGG